MNKSKEMIREKEKKVNFHSDYVITMLSQLLDTKEEVLLTYERK